jgi:hypothetical protein
MHKTKTQKTEKLESYEADMKSNRYAVFQFSSFQRFLHPLSAGVAIGKVQTPLMSRKK